VNRSPFLVDDDRVHTTRPSMGWKRKGNHREMVGVVREGGKLEAKRQAYVIDVWFDSLLFSFPMSLPHSSPR